MATPFVGERCDCHNLRHDGLDDLVIHFAAREIVRALRLPAVPNGDSMLLTLHGSLLDGAAFRAADCILVFDPNAISQRRRPR